MFNNYLSKYRKYLSSWCCHLSDNTDIASFYFQLKTLIKIFFNPFSNLSNDLTKHKSAHLLKRRKIRTDFNAHKLRWQFPPESYFERFYRNFKMSAALYVASVCLRRCELLCYWRKFDISPTAILRQGYCNVLKVKITRACSGVIVILALQLTGIFN